MNQTLLNLALALSLNEIIHNYLEVHNMRGKLKRLTAYMQKKQYKEMPFNIDTRLKSYTVSLIAFVAIVGPLWLVFTWLDLEQILALKIIVVYLMLAYAVTAVSVDKWHVEIERITRQFKKK